MIYQATQSTVSHPPSSSLSSHQYRRKRAGGGGFMTTQKPCPCWNGWAFVDGARNGILEVVRFLAVQTLVSSVV